MNSSARCNEWQVTRQDICQSVFSESARARVSEYLKRSGSRAKRMQIEKSKHFLACKDLSVYFTPIHRHQPHQTLRHELKLLQKFGFEQQNLPRLGKSALFTECYCKLVNLVCCPTASESASFAGNAKKLVPREKSGGGEVKKGRPDLERGRVEACIRNGKFTRSRRRASLGFASAANAAQV